MTLAVLALGAMAGAGLLALGRGLVLRPQPLHAAAAELVALRPAGGAMETAGPFARLAWRLGGAALAVTHAQDLAMCAKTPAAHAVDRLASACLLTGAPLAAGLGLAAAGWQGGLLWSALAALAGGSGAWWWMTASLAGEANRARREFRHALATYLDLVVTLLRGGSGTETALRDAASVGAGPAFAHLGAALGHAHEHRQSPWSAFDALGARLGVVELSEFAATMALAGESSARVRDSLVAKAQSLRQRELAQAESEADLASEAMTLPVVAMFFGFVLVVGFPAVMRMLEMQ